MPAEAAASRLLGLADVRVLLSRAGVRPAKSRGQSFVVDPNTIRRIVAAADVGARDVVLEIGPGVGSLTLGLLGVAAHVVAVEVDARLAALLPAVVAERATDGAGRLTVVTADAAKVGRLPGPAPTVLVANLPYNVAVPVLLHVLVTVPTVRHGLVMVQREVADRLTAAPGSRRYGAPTVKLAWFVAATPAGRVSPTVFWPVPHVTSGLVALHRQPPPTMTVSRERVFAVVDGAFAGRRKMLRTALAPLAGSPAAATAALLAANVDPAARAEQLDLPAFVRVAGTLPPTRPVGPPPPPAIRHA